MDDTYIKSTLTQPDRGLMPIDEMDSEEENDYMNILNGRKPNESNDELFKEKEKKIKKKIVPIVKKNNIIMPTVNKPAPRQFNPRLPVPVRKNKIESVQFKLDEKEYPSL